MNYYRSMSLCLFLSVVCIQPAFSIPTLDLTTQDSGSVGTAEFYRKAISTTGGTGNLDPFLQIKNANQTTVQGYNINSTPEFDEVDVWTKALQLSAIPKATIGGITYREFILDINENLGSNNELLSLDDIRIFVATSSALTSLNLSTNTFTGGSADLIYDFGATDWIKLTFEFAGSGQTDMIAHIPGFEGYDENTYYVYLYSKFGAQDDGSNGLGNVDGFEEWSVSTNGALIPAPGAIFLGGIGIGLVNLMRKRRML